MKKVLHLSNITLNYRQLRKTKAKAERKEKDMKKAEELYAEEKDSGRFCAESYQPIIDEIGNVAVQVDDRDYQGDSRILYDNDGRIGYLNFGWGSCSGCDALQACSSFEEVQDLMDGMVNDTKWFDSKGEALEFFKTKDWELEYSWHADEQKDFLKKVEDYLSC